MQTLITLSEVAFNCKCYANSASSSLSKILKLFRFLSTSEKTYVSAYIMFRALHLEFRAELRMPVFKLYKHSRSNFHVPMSTGSAVTE